MSTTSAQPALPPGLRRLVGCGSRDSTNPRGSATSVWPPHQAAPYRSRLLATAAPTPSGGLGLTNKWRRDTSSTRSWPFYTKSLAWTPSLAIDARRRMFLCRGCPARGTTTGASAVWLPISRTAAHLCCRHADRRATTTNAPTKAWTSTLTPTLTLCHFSGGRPRTSPLWPCCYAAARSLQPPRSDECASS
jgi:hypothetical protein